MLRIFKTLLLLFFILIAGCKKSYITTTEQEILFQMDVICYEPDFNHYGYIIDAKGNILSYNNPEGWHFPNSNLNITSDQIAENINRCKLAGRLPKDEIKKFSSYIENISSTKLSGLKKQYKEKRTVQYFCYKYSESTLVYKGYIIKTEGNYAGENLNFYSKKVVSWMKDIYSNQHQL
ncbi:MAG TPA: hypothetical protein VHO50_12210 [Bacteroidales bacterium]|nr:hypothetical protein [Bacteroidales bacterium]